MDTAIGITAYVGALTLTAIASLLLGGFVLMRARKLPGSSLLAAFLAGVGIWSIAQVAPAVIGLRAGPFTVPLIALSPLPAAAFVHLVFAFALCGSLRPVALASYALASFAALVGLFFRVGEVIPWHGFAGFFVPSPVGWGVLGVAAVLSVAGHLRLLRIWRRQAGLQGQQAGAVFISSLLGLAALSGFAFPAFGIDAYPWPVLLLPLYSVALVYGIVRHNFMLADVWARRALVWLLLIAGAGGASVFIAALPLALADRPVGFLATWTALAATLMLGLAILTPLKRMADRFVFPGARIEEADIAGWRDLLAQASDETELTAMANELLQRHLALPAGGPDLRIDGDSVSLRGWEDAPAATRHAAERFAEIAAESARRLSSARRLVDAEREARLAELGALAATVAHDLRNPLGIVQMAATAAPPGVRAEIGEQVARMNALVTDILDYARAWTVAPRPLRLSELLTSFGVDTQVPPDLEVMADRMALVRALTNLIDNARAMGTQVSVIAEDGRAVTIDVCDDGPGIAPEIAANLFRPFVSRRPGGTGLGLAIVRRIMEAHGGTVTLVDRPGWSTCFRLTFERAL
ncbi:ATP-binding protein [Novosphingobium lindaniclasticum]